MKRRACVPVALQLAGAAATMAAAATIRPGDRNSDHPPADRIFASNMDVNLLSGCSSGALCI